jgi:cytokinin dehydrogenase
LVRGPRWYDIGYRTFCALGLWVWEREAPAVPAAALVAANRGLFERNRAQGGTHYPIGALRLSRQDWERHYGPQWGALVSARRRYAPDGVFASGPDVF